MYLNYIKPHSQSQVPHASSSQRRRSGSVLDSLDEMGYNLTLPMSEETAFRITLQHAIPYLRTPISGDPPLESYSAVFLAEAYLEQEGELVFDPYLDWEQSEPVVPRQTLRTPRDNLKEVLRVRKRGGEPV
jgi:hypothetical protein